MHQAAAAVSVETYLAWETTATLRSAQRREALRRPQREERGAGISWRPPAYSLLLFCYFWFSSSSLPSVLWRYWSGNGKGVRPVKMLGWWYVRWWWRFDWSFAHLTAPVVTTTFIILCSYTVQSGDILVLAYPGPPGKWSLNELLHHHHHQFNSSCP